VKIRTQLALWYSAILLTAFLLIGGWAYYEIAVEHPVVAKALAAEGHSALEELGEILLFGGLPALIIALVGGWFLMRRALAPVASLTSTVEHIHSDTLSQQLPRSGNGDELDRLAEVFNSMMKRLDDAITHIREFTLNASHELKTPLTIMRGEIETRLRDAVTTPADLEFLAGQLDEIARLTKIVDGLILLAKADAGHVTLAREPVRLDELVRDNFADAQLLAQPGSVQVRLDSCVETLVNGDRHRLKQLLLNLTDNAIKYNQPGGFVTISLTKSNTSARLVIANSGPGIPPEKLPRVCDRFFRGDLSHSARVEGCGLGLSIVQWIVKAHAGSIQVSSELGKITTVTVNLPLDTTAETRPRLVPLEADRGYSSGATSDQKAAPARSVVPQGHSA
jgi:signal transduction histidine kinase